MKKIISTIFLAVLLATLVAPAVSLAQSPETVPDFCTITRDLGMNCEKDATTNICPIESDGSNNCGMCCLINTVYNVTDWLFYILLIAVVLMGVIGGVVYMTSAGNSEKAEKGKNVIIYAIIGLVLALVAKLVPSVVRLIVGM